MELSTLHSPASYREALAQEKRTFGNCLNVHDLPDIFHYWSNRHVRPKLLPFGFDSPDAMFALYLERQCQEAGARPVRFVSLGSGNCELEIQLARHLRARGHRTFTIGCMDLNPDMLARGRASAADAGLSAHLEFTEFDFNTGTLPHPCDAVIANQSLHHVLNLEWLFAQVKNSLTPEGAFVISDMIGRNGHQRWPEALEIVHEFWRQLPPSYRFNTLLNRYEDLMENWDCSAVGFEGVRAQDVLPLLLREFHFRLFVPFGNLIDPFVDRAFGHHFDAASEWDRNFIDEVHRRDDAAIASGAITPTHMLAVVGNTAPAGPAFPDRLSPAFCVRPPDAPPPRSSPNRRPGGIPPWPHPVRRELELACERLSTSSDRIAHLNAELEKRTAWARRIEAELEDRTAWAHKLEREMADRIVWARGLKNELAERTAWARNLETELEERTAWAHNLETELEERTAWACRLDEELRRKSRPAAPFENLRRPLTGILRGTLAGLRRRLGRTVSALLPRNAKTSGGPVP